jgi:hypothetical protein
LYPNGIYCYFATVDANYNSAYPYVVGPTFYGNKSATTGGTVTTVPAGATTYTPTLAATSYENSGFQVRIAPNPAQDFIAIQCQMADQDMHIELIDELGKVIKTSKILQGSTLSIIETDTVYNGIYFVQITSQKDSKVFKVVIHK